MTTTAQLRPGDVAQHPEKGHGIVRRRFARNDVGVVYADKDRDGIDSFTTDLTGWERVETVTAEAVRIFEDYQQIVSKSAGVVVRDAVVMMTTAAYESYRGREAVKPGHVQVRVDDLDPQTLSEWSQWAGCDPAETALLRVGCAFIARQVGQGDQTAEEPEIVGDGCECWVTPEHTWTTHYGAVEPGSQSEYNPRCPKHDEKPTSATVTLFCPDCGEAITREVRPVRMEYSRTPKWSLEFLRRPGGVGQRSHACQPAQPDEPTEFGARVTVTMADGSAEKWCRLGQHSPTPWLGEGYSVPGEGWDLLCRRGTVTLGWVDES